MKSLFLFSLATVCICLAKAQSPVQWAYSVIKKENKIYEVQPTSIISPERHIYSRLQPKGAIAFLAKINFITGALVQLSGKIKEWGKLEQFKHELLGISAHQYSNRVDFVQDIELKARAITNVAGTIEYQARTSGRSLLSKSIPFSLNLQ